MRIAGLTERAKETVDRGLNRGEVDCHHPEINSRGRKIGVTEDGLQGQKRIHLRVALDLTLQRAQHDASEGVAQAVETCLDAGGCAGSGEHRADPPWRHWITT